MSPRLLCKPNGTRTWRPRDSLSKTPATDGIAWRKLITVFVHLKWCISAVASGPLWAPCSTESEAKVPASAAHAMQKSTFTLSARGKDGEGGGPLLQLVATHLAKHSQQWTAKPCTTHRLEPATRPMPTTACPLQSRQMLQQSLTPGPTQHGAENHSMEHRFCSDLEQ